MAMFCYEDVVPDREDDFTKAVGQISDRISAGAYDRAS